MRVLIAAGGTGGHINPGIAIANKIKKEDVNSSILFVGTTHGVEKDLVVKSGYDLKYIRSSGISKKINFENIKNVCQIFLGIKDSYKLLKEFKPDIVIGTGGYVSAPVLYAASKKKIPTFVHESNAFPGKTVKFLSSRVDKVLAGFEETKNSLPKAKKVVITGNPSKVTDEKISDTKRKEIISSLGLKDKMPIVLVFGGSQGAKSINDSIIKIITNEKDRKYQIVFAPGPKQYEDIKEQLSQKGFDIENIINCKIMPYIYNMEEIMKIADLLVCRSGAMTVSEIGIVGKPSILIPFPYAAENHQEYNARTLERKGAAKIILDKDLNEESLRKEINLLIYDNDILKTMGENAKNGAILDSQDRIYKEINKK